MTFGESRASLQPWCAPCLVLICLSALACVKPLAATGTKNAPIWEVALKKQGFHGPRHGVVNEPRSFVHLAFSRAAVAVLFDEKSAEIPRRGTGSRIWLGWRLVGLFLNPNTGELLAKRSWTADLPWRKNLFPTPSGDFLLLISRFPRPLEIPTSRSDQETLYSPHPTALLLLSPTGKELQRIELPIRGTPKDEHWEAQISPSGNSLLLIHTGTNLCDFVLIDTRTFTQRSSWRKSNPKGCLVASISDHQVLTYAGKGQAAIGRFGSSLKTINLPPGHSQFLTDQLIVTFGILPWGSAWITKSTGQQVSAIHFPIYDPGRGGVRPGVTPPFVSSDGSRFGTVTDQVLGSFLFRREVRTLYVWQQSGDNLIFSTPLIGATNWPAQPALSDDGSRLAVANDGTVSMYALPVR